VTAAQELPRGRAGEEIVLRIELHGDRAFVSNFVQEGVNVMGLENPDNVAIDN
jgi:hypothetical protein